MLVELHAIHQSYHLKLRPKYVKLTDINELLTHLQGCGNGYLDDNEECDAYFADTCRVDCTCQSGYEPTGNTSCRLSTF